MPYPTSVRLDDELVAQLDRLASATDRPKAWLIEQAVRRYVESEAWQIEAIRDALADVQSGRADLVRHEDVKARIRAKRA